MCLEFFQKGALAGITELLHKRSQFHTIETRPHSVANVYVSSTEYLPASHESCNMNVYLMYCPRQSSVTRDGFKTLYI